MIDGVNAAIPADLDDTRAVRGSPAYRRISIALFLAGFATFSLLYCVQPLLPAFAQDFHVSPAASSLPLSLSTGFLALAILCAGAVSDVWGRHALLLAHAVEGLLLAAVGFVLLPASRHVVRRPGFDLGYHLQAWKAHLRDPGLPLLFLSAFLMMGAFVTVYNYAGFRLMAAPYGLSQTAIGMVASSSAGALADQRGRGPCRRPAS